MKICCPFDNHPNDPVCSRIIPFRQLPRCDAQPPPGDLTELVNRLYHAYANEFPAAPGAQVDIRVLISLADMFAVFGFGDEALAVVQQIENDARLQNRPSWRSRVLQSKCDAYRSKGDFQKARVAFYQQMGDVFQMIPTLEEGAEAPQLGQ